MATHKHTRACAYTQETVPADPVPASGPRERLHTEPACPYSLRVSTIERVLAALEADDVPFDAYAAIECMPLGQTMRLAASRLAPVVDSRADASIEPITETLPGMAPNPRLSAGEFHAVKGAR